MKPMRALPVWDGWLIFGRWEAAVRFRSGVGLMRGTLGLPDKWRTANSAHQGVKRFKLLHNRVVIPGGSSFVADAGSGERVRAAMVRAPDPHARFFLLRRDGHPFASLMLVDAGGVALLGHVWTNPAERGADASSLLLDD